MIELPMASLVECDQVAGSIDFRERRAVGEAGHVSDMTDVNLQAITASRAYSRTRIGAASETPNLSVERERAKLGAKIAKQAAVELLSAAASAHNPLRDFRPPHFGQHVRTPLLFLFLFLFL